MLASGMFCVSGAGMWAPRVGRKTEFRVDFIQKKLVTEGCLQSEGGLGILCYVVVFPVVQFRVLNPACHTSRNRAPGLVCHPPR